MGQLRRQASRFGGGTPDLAAEVVAGAEAEAEITVPGLRINDVIVAVINLTDGDTEVVQAVGHKGIFLEGDTSGDKLVVLYWSVGRGGSPNAS